jgi:hypothetical protein
MMYEECYVYMTSKGTVDWIKFCFREIFGESIKDLYGLQFNRMIRLALMEEVTFEQALEPSNGIYYEACRESYFRPREQPVYVLNV